MKTSKQIVVVGGPYRSLDLQSRERRARLIREVDSIKSSLEWKRDDEHQLLRCIAWCVVIILGLLFFQEPNAILLCLVCGELACIATALWWFLPRWDLHRRLKRDEDPNDVLGQKLAELAELPPE